MNVDDDRDPLEAELEAMAPVETSPALRRRIGDALAKPPRRTMWLRGAAGLLAAAACVAVAMWIGHARHRGAVGDPKMAVNPTDDRRRPMAMATPTAMSLGDYQRALAESPARLDALLDADSARPIGPPASAPVPVFARADRDLIP
jgi:hypothetical protein